MPTLKESVIDLADCNTSLLHLGSAPPQAALHLGTGEEYRQLYKKVASTPEDFEPAPGQTGAVLKRLKPAYRGNRYWHRHLRRENVATYSDLAWKMIIPLVGRPIFRLEVLLDQQASIRVSPVPSVLLYPFGWSTWISFRILGKHELSDLAELLRKLVQEPVYTLSPGPSSPQNLASVFEIVGRNVWTDAFGGGENAASSSGDALSVTTVLDKSEGAPSLGALKPGEEEVLRQLVSPGQAPRQGPFADLIRSLPQGGINAGLIDYALQDRSAVFIWANHQLKSTGRNRQHLRCYHNNTFLSLLQARHLVAFLQEAVRTEEKSSALAGLVTNALDQIDLQLGKEIYRNVCLIEYLRGKDVQSVVKKAQRAFRAPNRGPGVSSA